MTTTIAAKLSTDANNLLTFGSDNGIACQPPASPARGGNPAYTIDNSWGTSTATYYYPLQGFNFASGGLTSGCAYVWPLVLTRPARFVNASIYVSTGQAGSAIYNTVYASDATTGYPAAKVTDLFSAPTTTTGVPAATGIDATTVFSAYTLYWVASWSYSASATIYMRQDSYHYQTRIRTDVPTMSSAPTTGYLGWIELNSGWASRTSGPATLNITYSLANMTSLAPSMYLGFSNV